VIDLVTPVTSEQLRYIKRQMYYYYYTRSDIGDYEIYLVNHGLVIGKTGNQQHFVDVSGDPQDFSTAIRHCRKDSRNQYLTTDADGHLCYYHTLVSVSTQKVPYCITKALIDAVRGDVENGLVFCGANTGRIHEITTVHHLMQELAGDLQ
jgi:hypothetical protein